MDWMIPIIQRLTQTERVVFVIREALGFNYPEIAEARDELRKLMSRARWEYPRRRRS
ncbi:hypothetical protein ACDX78_06915 [Virgibacillus oceani]